MPAGGVQSRGDDFVDRSTSDEVLRRGAPIEDGGILAHVAGQPHLRSHRVNFRQTLGEGPLPTLRGPDSVLPLPQPVDLGPRLVGDLPSIRVLVPPSDGGREALVVGHDRARWPGPLPRLPLVRVERAPLRPFVDDHVVKDESAVLAHDLRTGVIPHEMIPAAFWALGCDLYLSHLTSSSPERIM